MFQVLIANVRLFRVEGGHSWQGRQRYEATAVDGLAGIEIDPNDRAKQVFAQGAAHYGGCNRVPAPGNLMAKQRSSAVIQNRLPRGGLPPSTGDVKSQPDGKQGQGNREAAQAELQPRLRRFLLSGVQRIGHGNRIEIRPVCTSPSPCFSCTGIAAWLVLIGRRSQMLMS
jgi:hypothetical protein